MRAMCSLCLYCRNIRERAVGNMSIEAARSGFEASFEEADFYNKQTKDAEAFWEKPECEETKEFLKG